MRATAKGSLLARAAVAVSVTTTMLTVAVGFVLVSGTLSASYFVSLLPGGDLGWTGWMVSLLVATAVAAPLMVVTVRRTIVENRRQLLDGTMSLPIGEPGAEGVTTAVNRYAAHLDVVPPAVRCHPSSTPLAYLTYRPTDPVVRTGAVDAPVLVVSEGLLSLLPERELDAVVAHELAHLANDDLRLTAWLLLPVFLGETMADDDGMIANMFDIVGQATCFVAALGVGVFTRGREFAADRAAAELTGDPSALAAALARLEEHADGRAPVDLRAHARALSAVNVAPTVGQGDTALHPPLSARIERLRSLSAA